MEKIRTVRLSPYRKGMGPTFTLTLWDSGQRDSRGTTTIAYRLTQHEHGQVAVLFEASDFNSCPSYADDSDETVACLLGFLTLKPGDTDPEYFESYGAAQNDFCASHAEALSMEALHRFGEI